MGTVQGQANQLQACTVPGVYRRLSLPDFKKISAHEGGKVISTKHRPPLPHKIFLVLMSQLEGHSTAERFISM